MLKKYCLSLLLLALLIPLKAQQNVILIIADDLGTDYLGFYEEGLDTAKMPNVRSMLADGVRFTQVWSFPYCSEIRASVMTGRYPFRTGVGTVIDSPTDAQLDTSEISIGKLLKSAAAPTKYATANIGKWHVNTQSPQTRNNPAVMGYDHYAGNFSGALLDYYNWEKIVDGAAPYYVTHYATSEQTDDAIAWLGSLDGSKPFFLWQAFNAPHSPYHVPPDSLHSVPGLTGTPQHIQQHRPEYFKAMVEAMDSEIGRLFAWLDAHNLRENTDIIFIGDNGDAPDISQAPDPQRAKGTVYEAGVHVPMIISGPAVAAPGRVSDALVSTVDLFATMVEMAGFSTWEDHIPAARPVDAVSLLPILKNEQDAVRNWNFTEVFNTTTMPDDAKAIRDNEFKLIRFDDGREEFYKINTDPFEMTDLLLQLPLDDNALAHYTFLCQSLADLVGTAACLSSVNTDNPAAPKIGISISPNPATGSFTLHMEALAPSGMKHISVFNPEGSLIFQKNQAESTLKINDLPQGIYSIRVVLDGGEVYACRGVVFDRD